MKSLEEMRGWLNGEIRTTERAIDTFPVKNPHLENRLAILQSILAALDGPSEEGFCDCDNYKWLDKELKGEAVFLHVHGWKIENRGPFKFCPYCGKRVQGSPAPGKEERDEKP
jgi:hypothetical protein